MSRRILPLVLFVLFCAANTNSVKVKDADVQAAMEIARAKALKAAGPPHMFVRVFDREWKNEVFRRTGTRLLPLPVDEHRWSEQYYEHMKQMSLQFNILVHQGTPVTLLVEKYPQCVAFSHPTKGWDCSAVIIASNAILSARHCYADGPDEAAFGDDFTVKGGVKAQVDFAAGKFTQTCSPDVEMCVRVLDLTKAKSEMPSTMPIFATAAEIAAAPAREVYLVGYGGAQVDEWGKGVKRQGIIPIQSYDCSEPDSPGNFGCTSQVHLVAAKRESGATEVVQQGACGGDSGGPVYVMTADGKHLAAITSYIDGTKDCSSGYNVYMRVDKAAQWLRCVPNIQWSATSWSGWPQASCGKS